MHKPIQVIIIVSILSLSSEASAQYGPVPQSTAQQQYEEAYRQWYYQYYGAHGRRSSGFSILNGPFINLNVGGGGQRVFGRRDDFDAYLNAMFEFILERELTSRTSLFLVPELGLHIMFNDLHFFGMAGMRVGWGARVGDLYGVARLMAGGEDNEFGIGLQAGVGAELYYGILAFEVTYSFITYPTNDGAEFSHSINFGATLGLIHIFYLFGNGGP